MLKASSGRNHNSNDTVGKRQFQTRTYETIDKPLVMKAMLNVLQDEGFIVYTTRIRFLGFIYGVKDFDTADPNIDISKRIRSI